MQTVLSNRANFVLSSRLAIILGIRTAWECCAPQKPHEPDIVAGLVLETTKNLGEAWRALFKSEKIEFSIFSVYCHQTPKVSYQGGTKSCEIGDILFVHVHRNKQSYYYNNSLLYQVKLSSKQPYNIPIADRHQLVLYQSWPEFIYVNSGHFLNGQKRNIMPKLPHSGAQYLLIDDRPPIHPASGLMNFKNTYPIGSCMPAPVLYDHSSLENELFDFLIFKSGRPFRGIRQAQTESGWSRVIWDLIDIGIKKAFNRARSGLKKRDRISSPHDWDGISYAFTTSTGCLSVTKSILRNKESEWLFSGNGEGNRANPPMNQESDYEHMEGNGTSLILFESWENYD